MKRGLFDCRIRLLILFSVAASGQVFAQTEITEWQNGKTGAVSLTYDDGIRTQFSQILPMMERLDFPGTFFVITGPVKGSHYPAKFIGRPVKEIIAETAKTPTDAANFFERASAIRYLGYKGTLSFYDKADDYYESGNKLAAYQTVDSVYTRVRNGTLSGGVDTSMEIANETGLSWADLKQYAAKGFEIASHTVTHAHLAIMDTANMLYELQKSKQDLLEHLGPKYTFSAEVPFGIEDPRVMKTALPVYAALRNLMPEPYLYEINRGDPAQPGISQKEYVQWQRGPLAKTSLAKMKSWIDTTLAHQNIWLVLVFHGVDGVGWEALPHELIGQYFQYIKEKQSSLWVASFAEVTKYMRERMDTKLSVTSNSQSITVSLIHRLDSQIYDVPLTLKTYVPVSWKKVQLSAAGIRKELIPVITKEGNYVYYTVSPDLKSVSLQNSR